MDINILKYIILPWRTEIIKHECIKKIRKAFFNSGVVIDKIFIKAHRLRVEKNKKEDKPFYSSNYKIKKGKCNLFNCNWCSKKEYDDRCTLLENNKFNKEFNENLDLAKERYLLIKNLGNFPDMWIYEKIKCPRVNTFYYYIDYEKQDIIKKLIYFYEKFIDNKKIMKYDHRYTNLFFYFNADFFKKDTIYKYDNSISFQ